MEKFEVNESLNATNEFASNIVATDSSLSIALLTVKLS